MGLTRKSVGKNAVDSGLEIRKRSNDDRVIALAGNPNVGKSTVFNELTGMRQHTGNWPGKTVANAQGYCKAAGRGYVFVDIPGTYSLVADSAEEEVARDFICFGGADAVVVVCDATCLERNMNLVLQTLEITPKTVVCINLIDEARKKGIEVDIESIEKRFGVPVIATEARSGKGLSEIFPAIERAEKNCTATAVSYSEISEQAISEVEGALSGMCRDVAPRWLAIKLLEDDAGLFSSLSDYLGEDITEIPKVRKALDSAREKLTAAGIDIQKFRDDIVRGLIHTAESVYSACVHMKNREYNSRQRKLDYILTSKWTGFPIMFFMLAIIFWITISGANYPSELLSRALFSLEEPMYALLSRAGLPAWVCDASVFGIFRVLAWVVSVMLPPMAIFFPLFTLLEDFGYLPRVAFNLDNVFKKCNACGKQSLTMCMGFGCNAAGVIGCRIINSPRERLIAMITNSFVPCNGRFPALISILTMFFVGAVGGAGKSFLAASMLAVVIAFGILMTFVVSKVLSSTVLRGVPSSFTLELPPYRRPQIGRVIVRSIFDRTVFVLGRAVAVAAPAGLIIWIMANVTVGDVTLLSHCAAFLDPFARLLGLDGVILMAFILGFPANEIVLPIAIMAYTSGGSLVDITNLGALHALLVENGWTWITAISTMLFSLMHWPCSTTLITIKKESRSVKWTVASFVIPTVVGMIVCFLFSSVAKLFI